MGQVLGHAVEELQAVHGLHHRGVQRHDFRGVQFRLACQCGGQVLQGFAQRLDLRLRLAQGQRDLLTRRDQRRGLLPRA